MRWACLSGDFIRATVLCRYGHSLFGCARFNEFLIAFLFPSLTKQTPTETFVGSHCLYKVFVLSLEACGEMTFYIRGVDWVSLSILFFPQFTLVSEIKML